MANKQTQYGWTYNKQGNIVTINPPIHANGKTANKPRGTKTGALLGGVGFGGIIGKR